MADLRLLAAVYRLLTREAYNRSQNYFTPRLFQEQETENKPEDTNLFNFDPEEADAIINAPTRCNMY